MPAPCPRCSLSEEILFTDRLNLIDLSHVRVELADGREGDISRPVPLATFSFDRSQPDVPPAFAFRYDAQQEFGADATTPASRQRRLGLIELQCP